MLFPTLTFASFFLIVYPLYWFLRERQSAWKIFILIASYIFYGAWDWRFVFLIILSTVVNQEFALRLSRAAEQHRRLLLIPAVSFNLLLLGVFKYYGFFIDSLNNLLHLLGVGVRLPLLAIIVPVGISFFTFQAITYIVDIYRERLQRYSLLDFAVYLAFFPHLVAGPIVRAGEFLPQLALPGTLSQRQASRAAFLILGGLFKKMVIASNLASVIVDPVFASPHLHSASEIILAVYGYAIQIYADFSGYTDMAIGIALLLGFTFPQNFDCPYAAASLQEFWHRWHMTLSRWLRDYLYIALGGNRRGRLLTYRNLILTMVLGGLWHGAALTFVAWGLFHGLGLAIERWWQERQEQRQRGPLLAFPGAIWFQRLITFNLVCIGWVLFRATSFDKALTIFWRGLTAWEPGPLASSNLVLVIGAMLALQFVPKTVGQHLETAFAELPLLAQGVVVGIILAIIFALGPRGVAPFIYYQF